jgi:hypothetical protein
MVLVSARRSDRHSSRGAFPFMADRAAHPARNIVKSRIPSAESRKHVGSCPAFVQARRTFQVQHVLAEFVAQFRDV